jgi:hypothetical protein
LIIPSATHDDPLLQARSPGEPGHKAPEKSGLYPKSPKVADDVIEAHGLLTSRFPALGILVARGVLPLGSFLDAGVLLERLLMARDRLDLSPQDPIETVVEAVHLNVMDPREADSESLADVRRSLAAKEAEVEHLKSQVATLQDTLEHESKQAVAAPQPPVADTAEQKPAVEASLADLRGQLASLKAALKQRHLERNQIRRDLFQAREELEVLRRQRLDSEEEGPSQEQEEGMLLLPEERMAPRQCDYRFFRRAFLRALPDCPPVSAAWHCASLVVLRRVMCPLFGEPSA